MVTKAVVTADCHVHPWRVCSRDGGRDRLMDALSVLRQSLDLAARHRAAWITLGDFKQPKTSWPQEALTGAHAALRAHAGLPMVFLEGNHDRKGEGGSGLAPFRDVAIVMDELDVLSTGDKFAGGLRWDGPNLVCAPWDADPAEVRRTVEGSRFPLLGHAFLRGASLGPESDVIGKGVPVEDFGPFPVALFGDVHKGQVRRPRKNRPPEWFPFVAVVTDEEATIDPPWVVGRKGFCGEVYYPGSPYQQNWGERNDGPKGALLVDFEEQTVELHPLESPRFIRLEVDDDGVERLLAAREGAAGQFLTVVYTGGNARTAAAALGPVAEEARVFQFVTAPKAEAGSVRADINAGMGRGEMLARYMDARPPAEGVDRVRALEAGRRLAGCGE